MLRHAESWAILASCLTKVTSCTNEKKTECTQAAQNLPPGYSNTAPQLLIFLPVPSLDG